MKFLLLALSLISPHIHAENIQLQHDGLTLNAYLTKSDNWPSGPILLITHGTLAHGKMELISNLQELYSENDVSSLALTLSLGQNDRQGMYDCALPHDHKHTDALDEMGIWLNYLKQQGAENIVLVGHSRGGNQTAWFASERDEDIIKKVLLIAPATWSEHYAVQDYEKRYDMPLAPILAHAHDLIDAGKSNDMMEVPGFIYCPDTSATAASFVHYYTPDHRLDTPYLLPSINKPVMVIAGSDDQVVKHLETILADQAASGAIQLISIDGAGHMFRDLYAEEAVDESLEFITD